MPPKSGKGRKALPIERFVPDDTALETSNKWFRWKREMETLMDYFEIDEPAEKKKCVLAHGGSDILEINHNAADNPEIKDV